MITSENKAVSSLRNYLNEEFPLMICETMCTKRICLDPLGLCPFQNQFDMIGNACDRFIEEVKQII